jgi:hypothetical protein
VPTQVPQELDSSLLRATSRIAVGFLVEKVQHGESIKVPSLGVSLSKEDLLNDEFESIVIDKEVGREGSSTIQ